MSGTLPSDAVQCRIQDIRRRRSLTPQQKMKSVHAKTPGDWVRNSGEVLSSGSPFTVTYHKDNENRSDLLISTVKPINVEKYKAILISTTIFDRASADKDYIKSFCISELIYIALQALINECSSGSFWQTP